MPGPINPTLLPPQAIAFGVEPGDLFDENALTAPLWNAGVAYALGSVASYSFAPSAWAVGTTYAAGQLASFEITGGQYILFMSLTGSNTGNVPAMLGSAYWMPISTAWDTILGVGNFAVQFQSLVDNNYNNIPYGVGGSSTIIGTSAAWALCIGTNAVSPKSTHVPGSSYFPPPFYVSGSETETTFNRETVSVTQGASQVVGGFQLVASPGGSGTGRSDANSIKAVVIDTLSPSFVHTSTFQMSARVTDGNGKTLLPGFNGVPSLKFVSATGATCTVNVLTGLLTGVGAGTSVITVSCGNATATTTATCS